jgi:hypothetical protein
LGIALLAITGMATIQSLNDSIVSNPYVLGLIGLVMIGMGIYTCLKEYPYVRARFKLWGSGLK